MIRNLWRRFLAFTRLDLDLVCEMSRDLGPNDYHDYYDDIHGQPDHFVTLTCRRCGKGFTI